MSEHPVKVANRIFWYDIVARKMLLVLPLTLVVLLPLAFVLYEKDGRLGAMLGTFGVGAAVVCIAATLKLRVRHLRAINVEAAKIADDNAANPETSTTLKQEFGFTTAFAYFIYGMWTAVGLALFFHTAFLPVFCVLTLLTMMMFFYLKEPIPPRAETEQEALLGGTLGACVLGLLFAIAKSAA